MLSIRCIVAGILLFVQTYWDLRQKEIPTWVTILAGTIGLFLSWSEGRSIWDMMCGLLPGILCLIFSKISKEAIGYGDGILLCGLGCIYSMERMFRICVLASFLGGVTAVILLVFFHKKGSYEMPFVPFLFLGWVVDMLSVGGI